MKQSFQSEKSWTKQRTTPWPEASLKTLTKKVDTVQSITQWCWRPQTDRRGNESPRPDGVKPDPHKTADHVIVNYGAEGHRAPYPRIKDHEVAQWCAVALEVPEAKLEAGNYHKVVLEEATPEDREQRQHHSQKTQ